VNLSQNVSVSLACNQAYQTILFLQILWLSTVLYSEGRTLQSLASMQDPLHVLQNEQERMFMFQTIGAMMI
jgi:hypothetical protein